MPRQSRLDIPGLLQHVIVRGIERRNIFRNNTDRLDFVERFSNLLEQTGTDCFAWALIQNHFHLLLRPNRCELKQFMRRLLTGYAVCFNKRHGRSGHLFQNRYKSIVCEEDNYLLELIRYIHLNPLRAGLVKDLNTLSSYAWCGHSVLMGKRSLVGQNVSEVLALFGQTPTVAQQAYLAFIEEGVALGRRPELVGGGLIRSCGNKIPQELRAFDDRILGSGAFVEQLRQEEDLKNHLQAGMPLAELEARVTGYFELAAGDIRKRSRNPQAARARDVFCYLAVRLLNFSGAECGRVLGIGRAAASHAVRRGESLVDAYPVLSSAILGITLND